MATVVTMVTTVWVYRLWHFTQNCVFDKVQRTCAYIHTLVAQGLINKIKTKSIIYIIDFIRNTHVYYVIIIFYELINMCIHNL